jgi:hypothetical protein
VIDDAKDGSQIVRDLQCEKKKKILSIDFFSKFHGTPDRLIEDDRLLMTDYRLQITD